MAPGLYMAWKGIAGVASVGDPQIYWSRFDGSNWTRQQPILSFRTPGVGPWPAMSDVSPNLAVFRQGLFLAWKPQFSLDPRDFPDNPPSIQNARVSIVQYHQDTDSWILIPAATQLLTSLKPSMSSFQDRLFVACRGELDDMNIWWSQFDGTAWTNAQVLTNVGTSNGPATIAFKSESDSAPLLYMTWRGADQDQSIWWATFDGTRWNQPSQIAGAGTSKDPAFAVFNNQLYLVWNGGAGDSNIYWSVFDNTTKSWSVRQQVPGVGTDSSPAIASFQGLLYMVWKGVGDDQNIWWTTFDGSQWGPQQRRSDVGTGTGPALALYDPSPWLLYRLVYAFKTWVTRLLSLH